MYFIVLSHVLQINNAIIVKIITTYNCEFDKRDALGMKNYQGPFYSS
jgi:hypothetical protein